MVFRPSKLDKDVETMEDFHGRGGYLDTRVRLIRKPNMQTGNIDVEYNIEEGEKFLVESIQIEGNTYTKSTVILTAWHREAVVLINAHNSGIKK